MSAYRLLVLGVAVLGACGGQPQVSSPAPGGAPAPAQSISVNDGESLIAAMHAKYAGQWPRGLTYTQTLTLLGQSMPSDQVYYVAIAPPGRERIDYGNPQLRNGMIVEADSTYLFTNGRQVRSTGGWDELLVLTQDVYTQPPPVTVSVLRNLGFQMSRMQTRTYEGRSTWVVGATSSTDSASKQFWVERDRLVLVRVRGRRPDGQFFDTRLGDFIKAGDGLIARQTFQLMGGVPRLHQQIAGLKVDSLNPDLFEPRLFGTVPHWSKP